MEGFIIKKILSFVLLSILAISLVGCNKPNNNENPKGNKTLKNISIDLISDDNNENCKKLLNAYLDYFKNSKDESEKLIDYRIESIEEKSSKDHYIEFYCKYSVKPQNYNHWMAANGEDGSDGWIVNKSNFVKVLKKDNKFYFESINSSPSLY